jgi:di/tricarboxylate transporter
MTALDATTRTVLSQDVLPTVLVFGVVVWLLVQYGRRAGVIDRSSGVNVVVPLRARLRLLLTTVVGGYGVFVVLAGGISLLAGESTRYIRDALVGGAVLAFAVVTPIFVAETVVERRLEIRRAARE